MLTLLQQAGRNKAGAVLKPFYLKSTSLNWMSQLLSKCEFLNAGFCLHATGRLMNMGSLSVAMVTAVLVVFLSAVRSCAGWLTGSEQFIIIL